MRGINYCYPPAPALVRAEFGSSKERSKHVTRVPTGGLAPPSFPHIYNADERIELVWWKGGTWIEPVWRKGGHMAGLALWGPRSGPGLPLRSSQRETEAAERELTAGPDSPGDYSHTVGHHVCAPQNASQVSALGFRPPFMLHPEGNRSGGKGANSWVRLTGGPFAHGWVPRMCTATSTPFQPPPLAIHVQG